MTETNKIVDDARKTRDEYEMYGFVVDEIIYTEGVAYTYMVNYDSNELVIIEDSFLHGVSVTVTKNRD